MMCRCKFMNRYPKGVTERMDMEKVMEKIMVNAIILHTLISIAFQPLLRLLFLVVQNILTHNFIHMGKEPFQTPF